MRRNDDEIVDLMREIAWLMQWTGDGATEELADMQREICRWRRAWPVDSARSVLVLRATRMSEKVLEMSGLVESRARA
jgi:hypothetical protein